MAVTVYGLTLFAAVVLTSVVWRYALGARLIRPDATDEEVSELTTRLAPGLAGYVVMLVLGLFLPTIAVVGYLAVALFILVPFGLLRRHRAD